jgi:hypothetical protein
MTFQEHQINNNTALKINNKELEDHKKFLKKTLEAQWAEPVSLTFNSVLRKLNIMLPTK